MTKFEKTLTSEGDCQSNPPSLLVWLASTVMVSLIIVTQFLPRNGNPYLRGMGVIVLLLGGIFMFAPFIILTKHGEKKDGQAYMQARTVVDRGLYAITRHPQYLGYIFLGCGFALLAQHWISFVLAIVGTTLFYLQAVEEEKYCYAQFGDTYALYSQKVPRFNIILGIIRLSRRGGK